MVGFLQPTASLIEASLIWPLLGEVFNSVVNLAEKNSHIRLSEGLSDYLQASVRGAGRQQWSVTWTLISL